MSFNKDKENSGAGPPSGNGKRLPTGALVVWLIVGVIAVYAVFILWPGTTEREPINYSALRTQVEQRNVVDVHIRGQHVTGEFDRSVRVYDGRVLAPGVAPPEGVTEAEVQRVTEFESVIPEAVSTEFITLLEQYDVEIRAEQPSEGLGLPFYLLLGLPVLLIVGLMLLLSRGMSGGRSGQEFMSFTKSKARLYDATKPRITFEDVAGEDQAKAELMQVVDFLRNPQKYHEIGARLPRGVLLIGPPGTGKTLLAKAVAGEARVPFYSVSASEFVEMFVGVGAGRVRDLFDKAKTNAPSIIFIDELDAVGRQRFAGVGSGNDEREQTLNQILVEMDGFDERDEVIVMSATNRPDVLDPALLRPGRFDRQVALGLPDRRAREAILNIHLKRVPRTPDTDIEQLARSTPGFSGADLANLVNEAALIAARKNKSLVDGDDFNEALDRIVLGAERPLILSDYERRVVAYHEAGHALVARHIPDADPLRMISIIPRGQALGVTMQAPSEDRFNHTRSYLLGRLAILMGGRAAERLVFNEMTTGAQNDLKEATQLARRMVGLWGMSDQIGPFYLGLGEQHVFLGREMGQERSLSDELLARAEDAAQALIVEAVDVAETIVREHRNEMDLLAERLLADETLTSEQISRILSAAEDAPASTGQAAAVSTTISYGVRNPRPPADP